MSKAERLSRVQSVIKFLAVGTSVDDPRIDITDVHNMSLMLDEQIGEAIDSAE